jgi:hypothetical protein
MFSCKFVPFMITAYKGEGIAIHVCAIRPRDCIERARD